MSFLLLDRSMDRRDKPGDDSREVVQPTLRRPDFIRRRGPPSSVSWPALRKISGCAGRRGRWDPRASAPRDTEACRAVCSASPSLPPTSRARRLRLAPLDPRWADLSGFLALFAICGSLPTAVGAGRNGRVRRCTRFRPPYPWWRAAGAPGPGGLGRRAWGVRLAPSCAATASRPAPCDAADAPKRERDI